MRIGATLVHMLPGVGAKVSVEDTELLRVGDSLEAASSLSCSPCGFRLAVGEAHRRMSAGERFSFMGTHPDLGPTMTLQLPRGGVDHGGAIYRVAAGSHWWWLFASTLDINLARMLSEEIVGSRPELAGGAQLHLRWDPITEVSIAYVEMVAHPSIRADREAVGLLEDLLASWSVAELLESFGEPGGSGAANEAGNGWVGA